MNALSSSKVMSLFRFHAFSDKVSYPQQSAAALTGVVFMKYSMDVIPKNWNLFSVNAFLAATAAFQLARKLNADYGEVCSKAMV